MACKYCNEYYKQITEKDDEITQLENDLDYAEAKQDEYFEQIEQMKEIINHLSVNNIENFTDYLQDVMMPRAKDWHFMQQLYIYLDKYYNSSYCLRNNKNL